MTVGLPLLYCACECAVTFRHDTVIAQSAMNTVIAQLISCISLLFSITIRLFSSLYWRPSVTKTMRLFRTQISLFRHLNNALTQSKITPLFRSQVSLFRHLNSALIQAQNNVLFRLQEVTFPRNQLYLRTKQLPVTWRRKLAVWNAISNKNDALIFVTDGVPYYRLPSLAS